MRVTIHQPMIFQPIYLWARFAQVNTLVSLGSDFAKKDGWHTRFKLNGKNQTPVIFVPLKSRHGKLIEKLEFADPNKFFTNLFRTLQQNYSRCENLSIVEELLLGRDRKLPVLFEEYCNYVTQRIINYLRLDTQLITVQSLGVKKCGSASQWLADIIAHIGGDEFFCAADATDKYMETAPFAEKGIKMTPQHYTMPQYPRCADATTSIVDLIMRCSQEEARRVLLS